MICGVVSIFAAVALTLNLTFPGEVIGNGVIRSGQFTGMYAGFPAMCVTFQTIMAIQCSGVNVNVALAMGARRRDYVLASQACMLIETLFSMAMVHLLYLLDQQFNILGRFSSYMYAPDKFWLFFLLLVCSQCAALGCMAIGAKRRAVGAVLMVVFTMGMVMGMGFLGTIDDYGIWGDLPAIMIGASIVFGIIGELKYLSYMKKATVV